MALLIKDNIAHNTLLGVWKKEETLDQLESVFELNAFERIEYQKISNESRKKEWLSTRILLTEILEQRTTIKHNTNGSPYLENHDSNISISHSKHFVAIIISASYHAGIDIEHISGRVEKVKYKFLNANEMHWCQSLEQLTTCWSAKETVFKIYEKNLDFHDMIISAFEFESPQGKIKNTVIKGAKNVSYVVHYKCIENDVLTYTLSKNSLPN